MPQRHPNDSAPQLWEGAADPKDPRYVPTELRNTIAAIPADVIEKMRAELHRTVAGEMVLTAGNGRVAHRITPRSSADDFETALI
jgi:hypothetical protein